MTENEIIKALENYSLKTPALFEAINLIKRQREEIDALRWTNKHLLRTEKEKRRKLWDKINRIKELLSEKNGVAYSQEFGLSYNQISNYLDQIEEAINHIKE